MFDKWFKKEKPFQGLAGFGGGATSRLLGASKGNQFDVTGGNATSTGGGNKYFYFTSPGNLTVASTNGDGAFEFSFMLIGAGGGGTSTGGGGGGAGAFVQKVDYPVLSIPGPSGVGPGSSVNFAVSIGSANTSPYQMPGNASTLAVPNTWSSAAPKTFTAAGGGRGNQGNGYEGGSGGGGGRNGGTGGNPTVSNISTIDGSGNTPDTGIGSYGGDGATNNTGPGGGTGGGGGGAGGMGSDAPGSDNQPYSGIPAGPGGLGRAAFLGDTNVSSSYGTAHPSQPGRWFAGGGGGGNHMLGGPGDASGGAAPVAGGGASGSPRNSPNFGGTPAVANTGGGGGGGGGTSNQFVGAGSAGANGICIVRVSQANISN